jgi:hypothetical protein
VLHDSFALSLGQTYTGSMHESCAWLWAVIGLSVLAACSDTASGGGSCGPNAAAAGLQAGAPWATYRGGAQHRGVGVAAGPAKPVVAWTFAPTGSAFTEYWPPSVASDGTLYVADFDAVYAVSAEGKLKWSLALAGRPSGSPTIGGDGTIYFSMSALHAVSPQGKLLWSLIPPFDEISGTAAVGPDGTIYVAAEAVGLYALGSGGCVRWSFEQTAGSADPKGSPAVGVDGSIYFGIDDALLAVDSRGKEQWRFGLGELEHLSPIVGADGTIYAATGAAVTALTPDGQQKWTVPGITAGTQFPPSISADMQLSVPNFQGLTALDASGSELWSVNTKWATAPVIDVNGVVYTSDSYCVASAIAKDGTLLWSQALTGNDGASCGGPVMGADGTIYYTSASVGIIAVTGQ